MVKKSQKTNKNEYLSIFYINLFKKYYGSYRKKQGVGFFGLNPKKILIENAFFYVVKWRYNKSKEIFYEKH